MRTTLPAERKGRRSRDTALEYGMAEVVAKEETRIGKMAVCACY